MAPGLVLASTEDDNDAASLSGENEISKAAHQRFTWTAPAKGSSISPGGLLSSSSNPLTSRPVELTGSSTWPSRLKSNLAWDGAQLNSDADCTYTLSELERSEVRTALHHFLGLGLYGTEVNRNNFPLPSLLKRLDLIAQNVHRGRGFAIIRGLDPKEYSPEDNAIVFLGISSYIGEKRGMQDGDGNMLVHILQDRLMESPQGERSGRSSKLSLDFHNDAQCDIIALQTRGLAAKGGRTKIASSWKIYEELAKSRPEILDILASSDWHFDTFGRDALPYQRPLLFYHDQNVILNFTLEPLLGVGNLPRTKGVPSLSKAQIAALGAVQAIARKHQFTLSMQPGDLVFINNLAILHSREAFEDSPASRRHLVRLWLSNETLRWALPPALEAAWRATFEDKEIEKRWEIIPVPRRIFPPRLREGP